LCKILMQNACAKYLCKMLVKNAYSKCLSQNANYN
jgi:hypothetical protein